MDAGYYECYAENAYGNDTAMGTLIVRRKLKLLFKKNVIVVIL